jgi:hypothetical protein
MFAWLRSLFRASATSEKDVVTFDGRGVTFRRPDGKTDEVTWNELVAVEIVTTDEGPFLEDVYWVLHGADRRCVVPQGAEGEKELFERLRTLQGFNHQAVTDAMCCTSNAHFAVWRRATGESGPTPEWGTV